MEFDVLLKALNIGSDAVMLALFYVLWRIERRLFILEQRTGTR